MSKFTVYTDKHGEFRWKFHAANNAVVAKSGESYKKQEDCLSSLHALQKEIGGAPVGYQLRKGTLPVTGATASAAHGHAHAAAPGILPTPAIAGAPGLPASPAISPAASPAQPFSTQN